MTTLVPPTPRSLIIGYVGGPRGTPVYADRVWADYWVKQIYDRLGGASGPSLGEVVDELSSMSLDAEAAMSTSSVALAEARKPREEQIDHYLHLLLAKVDQLARRVRELEDRTL